MTPIKIIPVIVLLGKLIDNSSDVFSWMRFEELSSSSNQCGFSAALFPQPNLLDANLSEDIVEAYALFKASFNPYHP